jgi:cellulose synthase/poly-beta-1,6-N-acetylglucosamine synthase-like glycosyltransferase
VLTRLVKRAARDAYLRLLEKANEPRPVRRQRGSRTAGAMVVQLDTMTTDRFLARSIDDLQDRMPLLSAHRTVTDDQRDAFWLLGALLLLALALFPRATAIVLVAFATILYSALLTYRIALFRRSVVSGAMLVVTDDEARAVPATELPIYTVLIPAYREPEVIARLLADVTALEYPARLLDVKLLIEEDDPETLAAVHAASPPAYVTVVLVPALGPRTKPKAVNYGLCISRGEIVTIFDAEDRPEPLQLRRAAVAFSRADERVVCLQARLAYFNAPQNLITRWFQVEYDGWFRFLLPGLADRDVPIPLGGTSNHIRRRALEEVGAWDPWNVTEDADLGIRLHRLGYRCGVLESVTHEEATSDFVNWARQRSRWHKGYLQTWLVHMRHPIELYREIGLRGFLNFNCFIGGTPIMALLNPIFWALTVAWFVTSSSHIAALFPTVIYYPALVCWVLGNVAVAYLNLLTVSMTKQPHLALAALLSPLYWVMMSVAAYKAAFQLFSNPSLWEKTTHGMSAVIGEVGHEAA